MTKPVYIVQDTGIKARVDGPSLWIERPGKAGQRIPFRFISRIHLVGDIRISAEFLLSVAENHIPLVISRMSGDIKAILQPFNHRLPQCHKLQRVILESKRNTERYIEWVKTYRKYHNLKLLKKFFRYLRAAKEIGEGDYVKYLGGLMPEDYRQWKVVKKIITGLHSGLLIEHINKAKLDIHIGILFRRVNFGFLLDISYVLESDIDEQAVLFFKQQDYKRLFEDVNGSVRINKEGYRNITNRFENKRSFIEMNINRVIDDFFCLARELNS